MDFTLQNLVNLITVLGFFASVVGVYYKLKAKSDTNKLGIVNLREDLGSLKLDVEQLKKVTIEVKVIEEQIKMINVRMAEQNTNINSSFDRVFESLGNILTKIDKKKDK